MDAALSGPAGRVALDSGVLTLGRIPENKLVITDPKSSSRHAEVRFDGDGYSLVDLGSTNGTFVNEQRLIPHTPQRLRAGDTIRIGDTTYTYEAQEESGIAPTVYAGSPQQTPGYDPTVLAPPPAQTPPSHYGSQGVERQDYGEYQAAPSPAYVPPPQQHYAPAPQAGYAPPPQQEGFAAPGYAPPPGGYPSPVQSYGQTPYAAPPQKKSRKVLWISLSVSALVVILACGICGALLVVNAPSAAKTLDKFCTSIKQKDGETAYAQFSTGLQSTTNKTQFVQLVDNGTINDCTHTAPVTSSSSADADLTLFGNTGQSQAYRTHLTQDSESNWKISSLQQK